MKVNWTPDKIIAALVVVGCFILIGLKINSEVKSILAMAAAWLFGTSFVDYKKSKDQTK